MTPDRFLLNSTSDRYELETELHVLDEFPGFSYEFRSDHPTSKPEMIEFARDCHALLIGASDVVDGDIMDAMPDCKVIARFAAGLDHIDLDAAAERGIVVTHYPLYCTNEVADHALALFLALNRRVLEFDRDLREGAWVRNRFRMENMLRGPIPPIREMTVGVVGIGRIGSAATARFRSFGATVIAYDPLVDADSVASRGATKVEFDELLARSDAISLHCWLTPQSHGMFNAAAFSRMKPSALLINTARGPLVDLDAVATALQDGQIAGAALDVVYPEPLPLESPLLQIPNLILTPHAAYYSERSIKIIGSETLKSVVDVLQGRRPPVVANPAVLSRVSLLPPR